MSKNFELLQQAEKDQETIRPAQPGQTPTQGVAPASSRAVGRVKLEDRALEEAVKLVQNLFILPRTDAPHAVAFTGVDRAAGCSTVCACAAEALVTQSTGTICLVDANLREPGLHHLFGVENRRGLVEALTEQAPIRDYVKQISGSRLWILTAGAATPESYGLLGLGSLGVRLAELRREFDYILIDTPHANAYADAVTIASNSDGIVLVLQAEVTHREAARKVSETIQASGVRLLGAVLNERRYPIPQGLYERL